jgi:hypothetical protein
MCKVISEILIFCAGIFEPPGTLRPLRKTFKIFAFFADFAVKLFSLSELGTYSFLQ